MAIRAFQCFRAGVHVATDGRTLSFSEADLKHAALVYSPSRRSASLVLGHPEQESDRYGNVLGLIADQDKLMALADVNDSLIQAVRGGYYKKVSASFLTPRDDANPAQGSYYLRHIGFLGAAAPSVKGMEPLAFAESRMPAAPVGYRTSDALYRAALDVQHIAPSLDLVAAARRVERALNP
jgi:hypothetical protein